MAQVYLLDVSYLSPCEERLLLRGSLAPPLSWLCAAELAQWTSATVVGNAWITACIEAAADTSGPTESAPNKTDTSDIASCKQDNEGYVRLDDDGERATAAALSPTTTSVELGAPRQPMYAIRAFPSSVRIQNKYFSTNLTLLTGALLRPSLHQRHVCAAKVDPGDVTAELLGTLVGVRSSSVTTRSGSSVAHDNDGSNYGGVLLARITQDPAHVPWHAFPRSGGGCLFHVVMVFLSGEMELDIDEAAPTAPESLQPLKERWNYFAVENGYECIFHAPAHPPSPAARTATSSLKIDEGTLTSSTDDVTLECVNVASGRRGLLEAPLAGSNRLYQILCNTLWPAGVRQPVSVTSGAWRGDHCERESNAGMHSSNPLKTYLKNAFVVVGNDEEAMWRLFRQHEDGCSPVPRRRFHFFTSLVSVPAHSTITAQSTRIALVNRYYAAIVQPRLVQTALFNANMQDLLDRYWELHMRAEGGDYGVCPDAPVVVLWPPSSSASGAARVEDAAGGAVTIRADADDKDVRASYPSLEAVLDFLARHGCREIVVVVSGRSGSAVLSRLTAHEALLCSERNVEVVQLDAEHLKAASAGASEAHADGPPLPVHREEDDITATRGVDRLYELLHCVHWGQMHRMTCAASPTRCYADCHDNSCLLLACGRTPFEEEAWVRELLSGMTLAPSCTGSKSATVSADDYLRLAAPTVLAALGTNAHGDDPAGLGEDPSQAGIALDVSTPYFNARVKLHIDGGLQSYYAEPLAQRLGTRTMPPGWDDAHDAYVIVTTLCVLQEAVRAIGESARNTTVDDPSSPETLNRSQGTLRTAISTLTRRQKQEWWAEKIDAEVLHSTNPKVSDAASDSPLVLLYITDVMATDAKLVELVEKLVCALARPATGSGGAALLSQVGNGGAEEVEEYALIELVFAGEPAGVVGGTAESGRCVDRVLDGAARVREAFDQHLWPHRQPLPHLHRHASRIRPTTPTREKATNSQGAVKVVSDTINDSVAHQKVQASSPLVAGESAEAKDVPAAAGTSAVVLKDTVMDDIRWMAPVIGCALPNDYLVDPETLRSVPVWAMRNAPRKTARIADVGINGDECCSEAPAQPDKLLPPPRYDDELLQWMEKMNHYGHRLGDVLRKSQAASLSFALGQMV
ncbi:hypothetical protein JKF63_05598 [Porcisia hertigi]|uniref:Uncharacterized protein n=1 Tax=Porcisia hertigi TaxID=2761500 RepID=A0A836I200_9TRYP|nr:hypothetical protein JKF63_05598 [Porcisia hertigi]